MRAIGVRELKAHLSRVLRDVQQGETVLVTDRGKVVAELRLPDPGGARAYSPLARLAASGHVRVSEATPSAEHYPESPLRSPAGLAQQLLDADRGDR